MSIALRIALLSLALCFPAQAQNLDVEIGTGLICDTRQQVERFVALFDGDADSAISKVNAEENDPNACLVGTVAFVRGPEIATARARKATFHIVRVLVVGVLTEAGLQAAAPAAFFSVEQVDERDA